LDHTKLFPQIGPMAVIYESGTIRFRLQGNLGSVLAGVALPNPTAAVTRRLELSRVGDTLGIVVDGTSIGTKTVTAEIADPETYVEPADMWVGKSPTNVPPGYSKLNMKMENICVADKKEQCVESPSVSGDPHIKTWNGEMYDFHGSCDLVMLLNPEYNEGRGMYIHIRTKLTKQWSFVANAAVRIGEEILEVRGAQGGAGHQYWLNGEAGEDLSHGIDGHPISFEQANGGSSEFLISLNADGEAIRIKTWKQFVRVDFVSPSKESFGNSLGLLGSYHVGSKLGRDGKTVIDDNNAFGLEWQVLPQEAKLFHNLEGVQAPEQCVMPDSSKARRHLRESTISLEDAELACARVTAGVDRDACIFDVLATNDRSMAGAY